MEVRLYKRDIAEMIADRTDMTKKESERLLEIALDCIATRILEGYSVCLSQFGLFSRAPRKKRKVFNPKTKELMESKGTDTVRFRPASAFCRALED